MGFLHKKTKKRFIQWFFLIFFLLTVSLYTQKDNIRFKHISIEEGLSQVSVFCMLQDQKGFMWFGTQDGLNRYDGYEFKIYRSGFQVSNTISDNRIESLYEDRTGVLWIGTNGGGLNKFDTKIGKFTHYTTQNSDLNHDKVIAICEDKDNILWIGTEGGGLNKFNPKTGVFKHYTTGDSDLSNNWVTSIWVDKYDMLWIGTEGGGLNRFDPKTENFSHYTTKEKLSHDKVMCIYEDQSGVIWIGTDGGGLNQFDRKTQKFTHYKHDTENKNSLNHNEIRAIYESKDGILWVGTRGGGLNAFNRHSGTFTAYTSESGPHSLSHNEVRSIYEDNSGILWVGTRGKGLNVFAPNTASFEHYTHDTANENSLSHNTVLCFYEDEAGEMWIGTHGGGLNRFNRKTSRFTRYTTDNSNLQSNIVWSICKDRYGELWIGTYGGGLHKFNPQSAKFTNYSSANGLKHNNVRVIFEDRSGDLWVGTDDVDGGLHLFDRATENFKVYQHEPNNPESLSNNRVLYIMEDSSRELWIGTRNGGLNRLINRDNPENLKFISYTHDPKKSESLSHNGVNFIFEDSSGVLWLGTSGGLNKLLDRDQGRFKSYRENDGLPNDTINAILEDNEGILWLSSNNGLSKFNPKEVTFRNFDVEDGLQSNEFNGASCFKSQTGEMYFGGVNGFNIFPPGDIRDDPFVPPVVITNFFIFNKPVPLRSSDSSFSLQRPIHETHDLTLHHRQNVFSFEFAALHYASPKKNQYKYMLEGWDKAWILTDSKNRRATYTNLPGGDYVFRVIGSNKDGKWNEEGTSLKLKILRPPWQTWWAYTLYVAALVGIVFLLFYVWAQRKKAAYEHETVEHLKQIDKLKNAFLSNTSHELKTPLNGIIGLTESLLDGVAGPLNKKLSDDLSMVVYSGKRLANLVNDILDFSRLKNKNIELNLKPVGLHALTDVVLILSRPLIGRKKVELVNSVGAEMPLVKADENRLQQIMLNLVGNAIKFTESGRVEITSEIKNEMLHVSVSDTGIGIPEKKFEEIFEYFEQVEVSIDRTYGGTGLGLAISKQLIELHGGRIWVESTVGRGSTFTFTLPLSMSGTERPALGPPPKPPQVFEAPESEAGEEKPGITEDTRDMGDFQILVVDDDPVNRRVILNFLDLHHYAVYEAADGYEALQALHSDRHFDLVLLDIMMPRMSGYEVCRKMRERFDAHELPVIFISVKNQPVDIVAGFNAGANDFITKPVSKDELLARIHTHLQLKNSQNQLIQNEKMASLGRLVSGLAHELNNPAAVLMMNSEIFSKAWKDIVPILDETSRSKETLRIAGMLYKNSKEELNRLITGLLDHSQRVKQIIQNLKDFSKKEDVPKKEKVDINEVVQASIELTNSIINKSTEHFSHGFSGDLPDYYGSFQNLQRVFVSLIQNACQALPDNTRGIHISTHYDKGKNEIVVNVNDEGIGIQKEYMDHIAEPFFSKWGKFNQHGLGLYISFQIIKKHYCGDIKFDSIVGKGTTVSVHLPLDVLKIDNG